VILTINGEEHYDLPDSLTVAQLLTHLKLPEKKSTFGTAALSDGDRLEIIHFIGGG